MQGDSALGTSDATSSIEPKLFYAMRHMMQIIPSPAMFADPWTHAVHFSVRTSPLLHEGFGWFLSTKYQQKACTRQRLSLCGFCFHQFTDRQSRSKSTSL